MGLKITNAAGDRPVLWLYGVIGSDFGGITANDFRQALETVPSTQDVEVRIHSEGGSYLDSIAMHANLVRHAGKKYVVVDGIAASGGSVVAMAGNEIAMASGSYMMIHEARGGMYGVASEFRDAADQLDVTNSELVKIYMKRWQGTEKELRTAINAETWLTADQAIERGLADVVSESLAIAAHADWSKFKYANVPQPLLAAKTDELPPSLAARLELAAELDETLGKKEPEPCESK